MNGSDACGQEVNVTYPIEVKENKILSCLKEIWVVVDCGGDYSHACNLAFYSILANGVKVMDASLDNGGKGVNDYSISSTPPPATFLNPHPEFPTNSKSRYNRILIDGALLNSVAQSVSDGIVTIEAICNYPDCHSGGVGRLRVYTSQVSTGVSWPSSPLLELVADTESDKPDLNKGFYRNFQTGIKFEVDVCDKSITLNSTSALKISSSSILKAATFSASLALLDYSSMALISSNSIASSLQPNNLIKKNSFKISNFEITNQLYADFLNATAKTDPNNLYNTSMQDIGIKRNATSGNYTYSIDSGKENYPVTYVSWYDAARYTNWLANGKPSAPQSSGTTENGSYNLGLYTIVRNSINPNTGVPPTNWLLNESEWYTSAYLKSDASALWTYPTQSNSAPDSSGSNPSNFANFGGVFGETTPVGFLDQSLGPFGTFDQGGNVREWTETNDSGNAMRIIRGGSWADPASAMRADESQIADPSLEDDKTGFRIGGAP